MSGEMPRIEEIQQFALLGRGLCAYLIGSLWSDQIRLPLVIGNGTYALAAAVVLVSVAVSGLWCGKWSTVSIALPS
jgi:hypothetical protein